MVGLLFAGHGYTTGSSQRCHCSSPHNPPLLHAPPTSLLPRCMCAHAKEKKNRVQHACTIKTPPPSHNNQKIESDKHNTNAVCLPPDEACNTNPARGCHDGEGGEGEVANMARACQEEANVVRALLGNQDPSHTHTLTQQSINNDVAFNANPLRARHDVGTAGGRGCDGLERGGSEGVGLDAGVNAAHTRLGAGVGAEEGRGEGREVGCGDGTLQIAGEDEGQGRREARGGEEGGEEGVGVDAAVDTVRTRQDDLSRKMRGLRRKRRKFTRTLSGHVPFGSDQKDSSFDYERYLQSNNILPTVNAQQICAATAPAKARSPLSKVKRDRRALKASLKASITKQ